MKRPHYFGLQHDQGGALPDIGRRLQLQRQHLTWPRLHGFGVELGRGLGDFLHSETHQFLTAVRQQPGAAEAIAQAQAPAGWVGGIGLLEEGQAPEMALGIIEAPSLRVGCCLGLERQHHQGQGKQNGRDHWAQEGSAYPARPSAATRTSPSR
ncbi:MAG: hypothetical protein HQ527_00575 [Cyanobacteria bacterium]|nr:hypothetical protein [Cyanobacteria bacterium bin.51]